ncbi:MAG TPA: cation-transporting P-type ATPase [Methylomirabilota bacterium]|nr:cation-transporting P-type ATPase [Methylomirabilota bacterium]
MSDVAAAVGPRISELASDAVLKLLGTGPLGLATSEAQRRLRIHGPNHIEKQRERSILVSFLKQFTNLFAAILWIAAALAFVAEWSTPGEGMAKIAVAIVVVIVVSGAFSFWQEYRAEQTLANLRKLLPRRADVLRNGKAVELPIEQLVPGDVVLLESGDHIPADCRLIEAFSVQVNTAVITGEPLPAARDAGPSSATELLHSSNVLLAGTSIVSGQATAVVFATGMQTEFGKIARLAGGAAGAISPLRSELEHLSRWIAIISVSLGLVFFAVGRLTGVPFWNAFILAIGIIVAMVPEGLLPTLTLALVLATQRMARRNVLIRHLPSVGTLGCTTVICTDKTGTLTQNRMIVKQLVLGETQYPFDRSLPPHRLAERYEPFFLVAGLCHNLRTAEHLGAPLLLGDPMEIALAEMAGTVLPMTPKAERMYELPFDADRMRMSTVHATDNGPMLYCKGAPESIAPLCRRILTEAELRPFTPRLRDTVLAAQNAMAEQGLRVLALAYRPLRSGWTPDALEQDLVWAGLVGVHDPPRREVQAALHTCREAGVRVIMTTGDHPRTALAIAREVGLVQGVTPSVITGETLRQLSETGLRAAIDSPEVIFARITADQKLRVVEALMQQGHVVAVTGDGVNDAPALKHAHVGVAMGMMGTDVAREAADVVLLDDNFASIVNAIEEGRTVFENIRKFLTYILAHNVPELVPYLAFSLFAIPLPLTPIQILSIDMGTDSLTALGLGVEAPDPQVMRRRPRPPGARLFDRAVAVRAYLVLGAIEAVAAMAAFLFVLYGSGWVYGQTLASDDPLYLHATTACLSAIIVMQIVNVFLCRSATRSAWATGVRGNRLILWGVVLEVVLILAIDYTALGNTIFGTAPISWRVWLFMLPFAVALLGIEELRKWCGRLSGHEARDKPRN